MSMKSKRKDPTPKLKEKLLSMNAGVCCVCKTRAQGVNFHHIDGDSSNSVIGNLAVLCVKDHDAQHRPHVYTEMNHLELEARKILKYKLEWEAFVKEAKKENPKVLAVVNIYGTEGNIHSMRLIFQTTDSKIIFERVYHLLTGPPDSWINSAIDEVRWLGTNIPLTIINKPLPIEYCSCCGNSLSNTIDSNIAKKITLSNWDQNSLCSIYINPTLPSLAITMLCEKEILLSAFLHKCGKHLHYICYNFEERILIKKSPCVRSQATKILSKVLDEWKPRQVFIGTGDEDNPELIEDLNLPRIWEN